MGSVSDCHGEADSVNAALFGGCDRPRYLIALVGDPNVGKSTLFNQVTGREVATAHYAGKAADIHLGEVVAEQAVYTLVDLPGTYGIYGPADEQQANFQFLGNTRPDCVLVVLDPANLSRNLSILFQVAELGLPVVAVLNLIDEARHYGIEVDVDELTEMLGIPVFETVAVDGVGVAELMEYALQVATGTISPQPLEVRYDDTVESAIVPLTESAHALAEVPPGIPERAFAVTLLQNLDKTPGPWASMSPSLLRVAEEARGALSARTGESPSESLARARHGEAGVIADAVSGSAPKRMPLRRRLTALSTRPVTGVLILIVALLSIFGLLFVIGDILARGVSAIWGAVFSPLIQSVVHAVVGTGPVAETLLWGLDAGLEASLAIGLPYILTFYVLLSVLEDTGYLNAVAFLSDRVMHHVGLHGRATIPLVAGLGCTVPAVMSIRLLPSPKERMIAGTLVSMVPCSARTAVIMGAVGVYLGFWPAFGVFMIVVVVAGIVGVVMDRMIPGASRGMVMEMFPFRRPSLRVVWRKAWMHFREFLFVATPIVIVGSMILGGLYESGLIWKLTGPLSPIVVGWLGLPPIAGLTLLFGLIRKEFALQLLVTLAIATMGVGARELGFFMTDTQIFVYVLVNTLAIPCISTLAVLGKVLGVRQAVTVTAITVSVALLVGGLAARVLPA